jgi:hypothetical protein
MKKSNQMKQNITSHIFNTISMASIYIFCILLGLCIVAMIVAKLMYNFYINMLIMLYVFSLKGWKNTTNIFTINEKYNSLCSLNFFEETYNSHVNYYDLDIVTDKHNITAYCINERVVNLIKNNTRISELWCAHSYIFEQCIYEKNIMDMIGFLVVVSTITLYFIIILWLIIRACTNNQDKIK